MSETETKTRKPKERPSRRRLINPMHGDEFVIRSSRFSDEYVITLRPDLILLRPKGSRRGGKAEVAVYPGVIYLRALQERIASEAAARRPRKRSSSRSRR